MPEVAANIFFSISRPINLRRPKDSEGEVPDNPINAWYSQKGSIAWALLINVRQVISKWQP